MIIQRSRQRSYRPIASAAACVCLSWPLPVLAQGLFEQAVSGELPTEEQGVGTDSEARAASSGSARYELNGYARADVFAGKDPAARAGQLKSAYGEIALKLRARTGSLADAYGEIRARAGLEGNERATSFTLREALINLYLGPLDLRFGHQIIVWGRADGFNPTDNLSPRDMNIRSANEDDKRRGNLALRGHLNMEPVRLELVWVPFFTPSRFPNFELPGQLTLAEPNYPDQNFSKGIGAARLHMETAAIDASISYLVGHATFPGIALRGEPKPDPVTRSAEITVGFSGHRHQVFGADFATAVGDILGLRGEVAYRRPFDYENRIDVPRPDLQVVAGIDKELFGRVNIILQYIGRRVFAWEEIETLGILDDSDALAEVPIQELARLFGDFPRIVENELAARNRILVGQQAEVSHGASLRIAWTTLYETLTLEVVGLYGFTHEDFLIRPKVSYDIADAVALFVGGEIYGGPEDTLFGMVDEIMSAGFVELRASF